MTLSRTSRDHDEIRRWAEERGAVPAEVRGTEKGGEAGILRFEFPHAPNHNDSKLEEISWDEFFEKFDERGLELVFQEKTADGERSNFNKLVCPENDKVSHRTEHSTSAKSGSSHSSSSGKSHSTTSHTSSSGKSHSGSSKSTSSGKSHSGSRSSSGKHKAA